MSLNSRGEIHATRLRCPSSASQIRREDANETSTLPLKRYCRVLNFTKHHIAIIAMHPKQMDLSLSVPRGTIQGLFFFLVLNFFSFSNNKFAANAYCTTGHRTQITTALKMVYTPTELSNFKTLTIKKLGSKLGEEFLLITSTVKASQSRSEILDCLSQRDALSGDVSKKFKAKIIKEQERYDREYKNYQVMFLRHFTRTGVNTIICLSTLMKYIKLTDCMWATEGND